MKIFISKFSLLLLLVLGAYSVNAQQWDGSTGITGNLYRSGRVGVGITSPLQMLHTSGNLRVDGRSIFFGETQSLLGNNGSAFVLKSNHESISQVILRNNLNENVGRVAATADYFGLRDADNKWVYITRKGLYSQMRVDNIAVLTARVMNPGEDTLQTRVGININNPTRDLHVKGDGRMDRLYINTNSHGGFDPEEYFVFVNGKAAFEEVRVQLNQHWGDYVFEEDYKPMSLEQLKSFITSNKHLPNMPKANVLESEGIELSDMVAKQMVNIEELVLYTIDQEEKLNKLEEQLKAQQKELDAIKLALLKKD